MCFLSFNFKVDSDMTITGIKYTVEPILFGLLYKVVLYKKLCNGYYEDWYDYTQSIHISYESAVKVKKTFEENKHA